jgi:hypothetical protein
MRKTVNQWIDSLPSSQGNDDMILSFRKKLLKIKADKQYKGYGGAVNVMLPENLKMFQDVQLKSPNTN